MRSFKQLEKIAKGFSNHRRIQILDLLQKYPELSVADIAEALGVNFKTISEHIRRLAEAGLVLKRYEAQTVRHKLTPRGIGILKFLRILE
ncbi:MAG: winged helix-turn-helix transcriptional regulator [Candidatus Sungbacteria bacterium]|uniref:Winged helix-turn-helix transcriptional regulator n=1 Tax=Candidatus Sungiibacteriota bacterium TaxID=2750080 RepID=A0A9D6LU85_9BACT|nr:winged helix-turn-helix transcriptional regulator [Candidatus Sungbacteria bacterium]